MPDRPDEWAKGRISFHHCPPVRVRHLLGKGEPINDMGPFRIEDGVKIDSMDYLFTKYTSFIDNNVLSHASRYTKH